MSGPTHESSLFVPPRRGRPDGEQPRTNRRGELLRSLGAAGSLALLGCRDLPTPETQVAGGTIDPTAVPAATGSQAPANPALACVLTPRQTEGPF